MAPPSAGPARTVGPRGLQLSLGTTLTGINAGRLYWRRGTEGSLPPRQLTNEDEGSLGINPSPSPVLIWNRIEARKGLPFGFEAGAALGQGIDTSLWTLGLSLKWALFEGFRTQLGRLPDVAVQGGYSRSVGSSQATVQQASFDITLSKPFVIEHTWSVSPLLGVQMLFVDVQSGVIDLTPGGLLDPPAEDAYASCRPDPVPGTSTSGESTPNGQPCAPGHSGADFANSVAFESVSQTRVRAFAGVQLQYELFLALLSLQYDVSAPRMEDDGRHAGDAELARQLSVNIALGAVL